jgi:2-polyprenyl-6-methoxyphenol hydroxylase-like FAD-dependent oxidoreductase
LSRVQGPLSIGIIGCGTAGGAAAIFLARAGHRVTVYEAVARPEAVGAGIIVQPTGMQVLSRLGLLPTVLSRGARLDALRCQTVEGRVVVDIAYGDVHPALFGLGMHRGVLFQALFDAAVAAGADVRCGVMIDAFDRERRGRPRPMTAHGKRFGPHDLVIVADGARSELRDDVRVVARDRPYPWGALWFVADDVDDAFAGELFQVVDGTGVMIGLLPTGLGPAVPGVTDRSKVSFFYSLRVDRDAAVRRGGLEAFKDAVLAKVPRAAKVLAQITDMDQLMLARYHDIVLRRFHEGRVVFIGDAAHAMSPQLGQGANLALYDAMVLADCVADNDNDSVAAALADYERRRRGHLAFYQFATRWLTPFFQSDSEILGTTRDLFMGGACRLPILRALMVRTMAGVKRGVVAPSFPIAPLSEVLAAATRTSS